MKETAQRGSRTKGVKSKLEAFCICNRLVTNHLSKLLVPGIALFTLATVTNLLATVQPDPHQANGTSIWAPLAIGNSPTTEDICRTAFFDRLLAPTAAPTSSENQDLLIALQSFARRTVRDDFSSLTAFLQSHPDNPWAAALETQLGREFYHTGHYSRAIDSWKHVWKSKKSSLEGVPVTLSSQAGSQLAMMYSRLGRMTELRSLLTELHQRPNQGKLPREIRGADEGLWSMEHQPEVSFRCGPLALDRICFATDRSKAGNSLVQDSRSTTNGFSALQVAALSRELGLNYQVAFRTSGAEIILPAVVHWKVGHYAALIARDGGLIRADDPTFGNKTWLCDRALDEEASGYFLVRSGPLPHGWRMVPDNEAAEVWGKGTTYQSDQRSTTQYDFKAHQCGGGVGMATWNIDLLLASVHKEDTPIGYTPPVGPPVYFTVYYDVADALGLQSVPYSNVAPDWHINWLAYLTDDPMNPAGDIDFAADGGGTLSFTDFNPTNQVFLNLFRNRADLVRTGTNSYELRYPDGSKKIFDLPDGQVGTTRRIYMTAVVDPAGNAATVQFEFPGKITSITDAIGQQTKLYYEFAYTAIFVTPDPPYAFYFPGTNGLLLTRVVDPFGRTASFQVDSPTNFYPIPGQAIVSAGWAQLTNIIDSVGFASTFGFSGTNATLTTPYGQTQFSSGSYSGIYRANWVEVIYPNGEKERVEYSEKTPAQIFSSEPLAIVPKGIPVRNYILWARNTYYWDRKAYAQDYSPNDYTGARIYHWTHGSDYNTASPILESFKEPLEHRVWFNYDGQVNATFAGTSDRPIKIARTMEDGTTQLYQVEYNPLGNITRTIDPVGRTFTLVYDTNDVDLLEVRQTRPGQNELLFTATYNSQHQALTIAEADLQTNRFSYNQRGQLVTAADPLGNTTTFVYDSNGYLMAVDGPLPGTNDTTHFTYDGIGRLHTATDLDAYTLVFDYDDLDRLTKVTYPDGSFEQVTYNRLDPAVLRDRAGRETTLTYDSLRQLVAVQDALGRVTRYQWCGCGGLESVLDPLGRMTSWVRDRQGRTVTKLFADGSQVNYQYDPATGWLKTRRDEQNQVTKYDYNTDGTLRQKSYFNSLGPIGNVHFTYDPNYLRIGTMTDDNGVTAFAYNAITGIPSPGAGALSSIDGPLPNDTVTYGYDELGRLTRRSINGEGVERIWDPADRLQQLTNSLGIFTFEWQGDSLRLEAINYPNRQRSTYSYYPNLKDQLLNQITHLKPDGSLLSRFTYDYTAVRQIRDWTQERSGVNPIAYHFDYDAVNRLTNAVATQGGSSELFGYSYDASENLTNAIENQSGRAYEFNALNEPIFSTNDPRLDRTYEWDAEYRLVAFNEGTHRTEFTYDGFGRRTRIVEKENGSVVSDHQYVWSGVELCQERDGAGTNVLKRFEELGVQAGARANLPAGNYFYARDHLFSIRAMTDSSGQERAVYDYTPYGARSRVTGDLDSDFAFTGFYFHSASALNLSLYRAYDPELGRWLSRDPLGEEAGFNQYAYASDDPITHWDPFGLEAELIRFGTDTKNAERAKNLQSRPGELTVAAHGNEGGPGVEEAKKGWRHLDVKELATEIEDTKLKNYPKNYDTIRLLSCQTALGKFPQDLANKSRMRVLATTKYVGLGDNGKYVLYEDKQHKIRVKDQEAAWIPFEPNYNPTLTPDAPSPK